MQGFRLYCPNSLAPKKRDFLCSYRCAVIFRQTLLVYLFHLSFSERNLSAKFKWNRYVLSLRGFLLRKNYTVPQKAPLSGKNQSGRGILPHVWISQLKESRLTLSEENTEEKRKRPCGLRKSPAMAGKRNLLLFPSLVFRLPSTLKPYTFLVPERFR